MSSPRLNLIGLKYNRLTVIAFHGIVGRSTYWVAKCDCGNTIVTMGSWIKSGDTKSCGCLWAESVASNKSPLTHGLSRHPIYRIWAGLKDRCYNKNTTAYKDYGGRGIVMCDEWRNDFKVFFDWAIANGWKKGLEVDRFPNNDGNYEPSNCRITTHLQNMRNTRVYKMTLVKVMTIKNLFNKGAFTATELAGIFQVGKTAIYKAINQNYIS